jgi:phosphoglycolate phosphatase
MPSIHCLDRKFDDIDAIIFDKDGTLEDSGDYLRNLAQKRARLVDAQIPGVGEPLLMAFGVNGNILDAAGLQAVGSRHAIAIVDRAFMEADRVMESSVAAMFPGCVESIESYANAGIKLGILSAATTNQVTKFAEYHQIQSHFQVLLGSDKQFAKPDSRLFTHTCQQMGVDPARTLMVGDSVWDMQMASRAGAAGCIGISWHQLGRPLAAADVMITSLAVLVVGL